MSPTSPEPDLPEIRPDELKARMDRGEELTIVDVREPHERKIADLPPGPRHHIPLAEFLERMGELDGEEEIVVYCRSGARSGWAVRHLLARGYTKVWNLKGGILGWRDEVDPSLQAY